MILRMSSGSVSVSTKTKGGHPTLSSLTDSGGNRDSTSAPRVSVRPRVQFNLEPNTTFSESLRFKTNVFLSTEKHDRCRGRMGPREHTVWSTRNLERHAYIQLLRQIRKCTWRPISYVDRFKLIRGDCDFLRALTNIWEKGTQILRSLRTRMHDLDDFDINAAEVFFMVLGSFVQWYYRNTKSQVEARQTVINYHIKVEHLLRKMSNSYDNFTMEAFLLTAERARNAALNIAQYEAVKAAAETNDERIRWNSTSIANRLAAFMLLRARNVNGEEEEIAKRYMSEGRGPGRIRNLVRCLDDIERIAETFKQAEIEYRFLFASSFLPRNSRNVPVIPVN